jgi:DNA-binding NarL/FixJ family response regulator
MGMRAVLIDDHALIRDSLKRVLTDNFHAEEVFEAEDLDTGLQLISAKGQPDLIMVDLNMPGSSGAESVSALVEAFPASNVIVISASDSQSDVLGCLSAGVNGYIPKSHSVPEMVSAIQQVMDGAIYVPRQLKRRGVTAEPRPRRDLPGAANLTPRQRDVLDQLLLGRSSKEIARALAVAEGTVKIHLAAIYRALGVRTRAEAIAKLMSS